MKTLRVTAALLLMASSATAAPALAQMSAGFGPAPSVAGPARGIATGRHGSNNPSLSGRPWQGDDRPHHCGRRGRCRDRNFYGFGYGYGSGYGQGLGYRDMMAEAANGYFSHGGEIGGMRNGRPSYDYDRGYPYEYYSDGYYSDGQRAEGDEQFREYSARSRECETELTRDRRSGKQLSVRVCRN